MKKIIYITYMLLALSFTGYGQDDNENYVKTHVYLTPNPGEVGGPRDTINAQIGVTYIDGLGRPKQQIAVRAGGNKKNIITHMEYDIYGRQAKQYLPYSTGSYDMMYDPSALLHTNTFYNTTKYENTTNPYSESFFEDSPLSRVKKTAAPGVPWKGNVDTDNNPDNDGDHTVKMKYSLNQDSDRVRYYYVAFLTNNPKVPSLAVDGYYQPGELYKTITKDENWTPADGVNKTTEEYTDKLGHLVLKRNHNAGTRHDTHYVYDKYNNLTYVIPPLASDQIVELQQVNDFLGVAYPWVSLSYVSQQLADDYNRELIDYDNTEILNVDLLDKYGGQGGFSLVPTESGGIALNLNVTTSQPMPLRTGVIADLKTFGNFHDKELGRISGSGFEYYFLIQSNTLIITGNGNVPSQYLNTTLTGDTPLDYSKNYPWTSFCKGDASVMEQYNRDIKTLDNSEILTTYTANPYNALGGVAISLDNEDDFTITFNMSTATPMELVSGTAFPLEFARKLPDVTLGFIQGDGYFYEFSIRDNNLHIAGSGFITHLNFWNTRRFSLQEVIKTQVRDGLCYIYNYDERNRTIQKKIPGKDWEYIVYDRLDRVVATQDKNLRDNNQWLFTKYDPLGRVAYTGMFSNASSLSTIRDLFNVPTVYGEPGHFEKRVKIADGFTNSGATVQYSDDNYPTNADILELYTVTYYDNDNEIDMDGLVMPTTNPVPTTQTQGLVIGGKVRVLGSQQWIYTRKGYDDKGREIWGHTKNNYLGSEDITRTSLDFTGRVIMVKNTHKKTGLPDFDVYNAYQYDNQGRVLKHRQSQTPMTGWDIGPYQHVIAENTYDELGMQITKGVGGKTSASQRLQTVDYTYNVRGWLKGINNISSNLLTAQDLFAFRINYNTTNLSGSTALFNGNISETRWKTKHDNVLRSYSYTYDDLNRLTSANYNGSATGGYTEGPITYDKNGNILSLKRYGYTSSSTLDVIDNLTYTYGQYSNQLLKVGDAAGADGFYDGNSGTKNDYAYDGNGNMLYDLNKDIGRTTTTRITYNHLNLPTKVYFGTVTQNKYIDFVYDATGVKQEKKMTDGSKVTITQYDNGFIYEKVNTGANTFKFFNHAEGYAMAPLPSGGVYNPDNFKYIYQYKDHLGNIRLSYTDNNGNGAIAVDGSEIISENNYYAFGMEHTGYNSTVLPIGSNKAQQFKYQGQERQDELGLNWDSFKWRNYDYAIGRFFNIDPLAESYSYQSPYNFAENRVIDGNELEGLEWQPVNDRGENVSTNANNIASYTWAADYNMSFGTLNRKGAVTSGLTGVTMTPREGTVSSASVQGRNSENVEGATFYSVANNLSPVIEFSALSEKSLSYVGGMETFPTNTSKEWAEGDLTMTSTYENGKTITDGSWSAISGPWGNGPLQNGDYSSNNLRNNRGGSYANHGVGFTFDLNPTFSTGRTDLRFHPDGGTPGTLGCIGLTGNATQLSDFRTRMSNYLSNHNSIDVNVDINNNPNNDGL